MTFDEIILKTVKNNIPVTIKWKDNRLMYEIPGFSKSGTIDLYQEDEIYWTVGRYNTKKQIEDFRDLVFLAYCWWLDYKDRSPFENPNGYWKNLMIEYGFLKVEIKEIETYS